MTVAEGKEVGWEFFETPPAYPFDGAELVCCGWCGTDTAAGFMEMEAEAWRCPDCFARMRLPEGLYPSCDTERPSEPKQAPLLPPE